VIVVIAAIGLEVILQYGFLGLSTEIRCSIESPFECKEFKIIENTQSEFTEANILLKAGNVEDIRIIPESFYSTSCKSAYIDETFSVSQDVNIVLDCPQFNREMDTTGHLELLYRLSNGEVRKSRLEFSQKGGFLERIFLPTTGSQASKSTGFIVASDTTAPAVSVTHSPQNPTTSDKVTITATASDPSGISAVRIYVDGNLAKRCKSSTCGLKPKAYPAGTHTYYATALDKKNNMGRDPATGTKSFTVEGQPSPAGQDLWVYQDALNSPWIDVSYTATNDFSNTQPVYAGTRSIKVTQGSWGALSLHSGKWGQTVPINPSLYSGLEFAINGGPAGIKLSVGFNNDAGYSSTPVIYGNIPANQWVLVSVPMSQFDPANQLIDRLVIQDINGASSVIYYVDNIRFFGGSGTNVTIQQNDITPPTVSVNHLPSNPTSTDLVTITATATDADGIKQVQIYVDNTLAKTCNSSPCSSAATYAAGMHTYYATALDNSNNTGVDPLVGTNSFNVTETIVDTTPPTISVSHAPQNPTPTDFVTITASASDASGIRQIQLYADNNLVQTCTSSPCISTPALYPSGTYTYYATAIDNAPTPNTGRDPASGTKSFTVEVAQLCTPGTIQSGTQCLVCNAQGSAYAQDNTKCSSGQTCSSNGQCVTSTSGLVLAYGMNEGSGTVVNDLSGNGNTGTLVNGVAWTTSGRYGGALSFDGANDYVTTPLAKSSFSNKGFTLEAWVRATSSTGWRWIFAEDSGSYFFVGRSAFGQYMHWGFQDIGISAADVTNAAFNTNTWYFVAVTWDGTTNANGVKLWLNGALVGQATATSTTFSAGNINIGARQSFNEYWQGEIDEVRIYNRALSQSEIQGDMNTAIAPLESTPPTVSITSPANGATVSGTITITATASDNVGVAGVQFKVDGNNIGAEDTTSPYSVSFDTTTVGNGNRVLSATARDTSGNTATSSSVTINVNNVDITPPTVSVSISPATPNSTQTVTYMATASDVNDISSISIYVDNVNVRTCASVTTCSYTGGPYAVNSTHTYYATATDNSPNRNLGRDPASGTKSFTVLNLPLGGMWVTYYNDVWTRPPASEIDYSALTHIITGVGAFEPSTSPPYYTAGPEMDYPYEAELVNRAHAAGVKVILELGSIAANYDYIASDQTPGGRLDQYVNNVVNYAKSKGYDGVDVDWEFPWPGSTDSKHAELLKRLRAKLDTWNPRGTLMIAVHNSAAGNYIASALNQYVDQVNMMNYDLSGFWTSYSGFNTAINKPSDCPNYNSDLISTGVQNWFNAGVTPSKLGLGLSFMGYIWPNIDAYCQTGHSGGSRLYYSEVIDGSCNLLNKATYHWQNDAQAPWLSYNGPAISGCGYSYTKFFASYDNPQSIAAKVNYAKQKGLGGIMIWQQGGYVASLPSGQRNPLLQAVKQAVFGGTPSDTMPPTVSIISPASGATVSGTITITATASDNVGVAGVQFKVDGSNLGSEITTSPYTTSWNSATVANGTHTISATARDAAGNTATATISVTVSNGLIQARYNYGALLEPNGKIFNCAGQDIPGFNNYWNVMNANNKPPIFMTYINLKDVTSTWITNHPWYGNIKNALDSYNPKTVVLQVGLAMTTDGNPSSHYEQDVAAGLYDTKIDQFIAGLAALNRPAYIRIGYEFNGGWNGYVPSSYKAAFQYVTNKIRASGLPIATVWDFSMDGAMNYMDYYPGDAYVDWWGINIFSASAFSDNNALQFMNDANTHQKPVMIGESTPRYMYTTAGQSTWDAWFIPFFNFIHNQRGVKMFCYINWNWDAKGWGWGDARIEANTLIAQNFNQEISNPEYLHADTTFPVNATITDTTPPAVSITSPTSGATFTTSQITVSGTASDNVAVSSVRVRVNSGAWQTASGTTSWSTTVTLASGSNTIDAQSFDTSNNPSTIVSKTVTYNPSDTTNPTVSITSPANGATVSGTITISASASDNVGVAGVQFKVDGNNIGSEDTTSPYSISLSTLTLTNGNHILTATARDTSGNTANATITVNVNNVVPDTTPPTVSVSHSPASPSSSQQVTLTATASDPSGISQIQIYVDNTLVTTCSSSTTCNYIGGPYTAGSTHTYYARATDNSPSRNNATSSTGSFSVSSAGGTQDLWIYQDSMVSPWISWPWSSTVTLNNPSPVYAGTSSIKVVSSQWGGESFSHVVNGNPVLIDPTLYRSVDLMLHGGTTGLTVFFHLSSAVANPTTGSRDYPSDTTISRNIPANQWTLVSIPISDFHIPPGQGVDQFHVQDGTGRTWYIDDVRFVASGVDTTAPVVSVSHSPASPSSSQQVTLTATASDPSGINNIKIYVDNTNVKTCTSTTSCSYTGGTYTAGSTHTYYATATDNSPNANVGTDPASGTKSFTVTAPDTTNPSVSITSPTSGATFTTSQITVSGTASDDVGLSTVEIRVNNVMQRSLTISGTYATWSTTVTLAAGSNTIQVQAFDTSNKISNVQSVGVTYNAPVDNQNPVVSITSPANGARVSGTITISASASDNVGVAGVQFKVDGSNLGSEITTSPYTTSWNSATVANGTHTISATARDAAGNTATATISVTVANAVSAGTIWVSPYYASWQQGWHDEQGYYRSDMVDFTAMNYVMHFYLGVNGDRSSGSWLNNWQESYGMDETTTNRTITRAHAAGTKILFTVAGNMNTATNDANRASFINDLVNFMQTRGYDGIDIDWEPLNSGDATNFVKLINDLYARLQTITPRPLLTTAAVPYGCSPGYGCPYATVWQKFDQINIMTYDLAGNWPGWVTWFNTALYAKNPDGSYYVFPSNGQRPANIDDIVESFHSYGIPYSKLGIGADWYIYDWSGGIVKGTSNGVTAPRQEWTTTPTVWGGHEAAEYYRFIDGLGGDPYLPQGAKTPGITRIWDSGAQVPYWSLDNLGSSNDHFVNVDDEQSTVAKINYVKQKGLGGIIIWEIAAGYRANQPAGQRDLLLQAVKRAAFGP